MTLQLTDEQAAELRGIISRYESAQATLSDAQGDAEEASPSDYERYSIALEDIAHELARVLTPALTTSAPLDLEPWVGRNTRHRYSAGKGDPGVDIFDPRPGYEQDENRYPHKMTTTGDSHNG